MKGKVSNFKGFIMSYKLYHVDEDGQDCYVRSFNSIRNVYYGWKKAAEEEGFTGGYFYLVNISNKGNVSVIHAFLEGQC